MPDGLENEIQCQGATLTARHHDVVRALKVATGQVVDACHDRHRHQEFLAFLRQVARAYPIQTM